MVGTEKKGKGVVGGGVGNACRHHVPEGRRRGITVKMSSRGRSP